MERLYNNLIKCISISVKQAIEESIGTLQIDNNIDKIYNDIENNEDSTQFDPTGVGSVATALGAL